jgi:ribosomal protein S18 acetylase RimI-like enzyme
MSKLVIREAELDDAAEIAKVHVDTWRSTYRGIIPDEYLLKLSYQKRQENWMSLLGRRSKEQLFIYVVEKEDKQIVGFACGGKERTSNPIYKGELQAIYMLKAYQNQGIGKQLVKTIATCLSRSNLNSMLVWVLADNLACQFYEALGGQKVSKQTIERGGVTLCEIAYGWIDTQFLIAN